MKQYLNSVSHHRFRFPSFQVPSFQVPSFRSLVFPSLFLLALYMFARAIFFVANFHVFASLPSWDIVSAFGLGLRFDIAFLMLWNLPFILMWCASWGWLGARLDTAKRFALGFFLLLNLPPLFTNFGDAAYFPLSGRRSSLAVLSLWHDFIQQAWQLLYHYWLVPAGAFLFTLIVLLAFRRWARIQHLPRVVGVGGIALRIVLVAFALLLGIRSSFGVKPLGTWDAYRLQNTSLGALALNTPFTCLKVDANEKLQTLSFFNSDEQARRVLRGDNFTGASHFPKRQSNVVIFVLESFALEFFGSDFSGPTYMPYLRSLAEQGYFAKNAFANARSSIQALPSVLMSIPPFLEEPYVRSIYNGTRANGIASVLKDFGYSSAFFHGARNGSMYIDTAARLAGFQQFYGMSDYPNSQKDWDGTWGVFDEPFLQFMATKVSQMRQPFVAGYFSLSSHNPYAVPKQYEGRFPKGNLPILESIGYADYAIQRFIEAAKKQPWYENTIFVFVADHAVDGMDFRFLTDVGRYRVPLIFFDPSGKLPRGQTSKMTQQLDILPSILDALGISQTELATSIPQFGVSVFDEHSDRVILYSGGDGRSAIFDNLWVRPKDSSFTNYRVETVSSDFLSTKDAEIAPARRSAAEEKWKAAVQLFHNGLEKNTLVR